MIPLSVACMQRRWVNDKDQIQLEIIADKSVVELGYGEHLLSAFNKIVRNFGTMSTSENTHKSEMETTMQWCNMNISDVMRRKEHLKDELYYRAIRTKSNYVKAVTIILLDKLGFKMRERYTGAVVENCIELLCDPHIMEKYEPIVVALESARFDRQLQSMISSEEVALEAVMNKRKKIKVELPSQYEIDAIAIELDKVTNHADRIFVIDLIYEVLERISNFEEAISLDPSLVRKWSGKINAMKESLEKLRLATLEKKTFPSSYKLFVRLPEAASDYSG